jgi:amino acid adenylation domain-containing protein
MQQSFEGFRLSPQQQRVWSFINQENGATYCAQAAVSITGDLDLATFHQTLTQVVTRHEILRTTFYCLPEMTMPLQAIAPPSQPELLVEDWSHRSKQDQRSAIDTYLMTLRQQPFNLSQEAMVHLVLIRQSSRQHTLLLHLPALCADAVALYNLAQAISTTYAACIQNQTVAEEPLQYADIAEWQHEILEDESARVGQDYWNQLAVTPIPTPYLPFEKPSSEPWTFEPQVYPLKLAKDLLYQAETFVQQRAISVSTLFLTCWQIFLWRLTQPSHLLLGIGCQGRAYEELQETLGLFAKTLPLDCVLEESTPFLTCLEQTQQQLDQHDEWQDYCVGVRSVAEKEKCNPSALEQNPPCFCPFGFEFSSVPEPWRITVQPDVADVMVAIQQVWVCSERFKVKLVCQQQGGEISAVFQYDSQCYLSEHIQHWAGLFKTLLSSALQCPESTVGQLDLLTPAERQHLQIRLNPPQHQLPLPQRPSHQWLHQFFEAQVSNNPGQIAVLCPDETLSYGELNLRSNQLAHYLRSVGVQSGALVGLCVTRSPLMAVGVLGILKAGAAYVPLDPTYPTDRLNDVLQDVQVSILVTQAEWGRISCPSLDCSGQSLQRVYLDQQWPVIAQFPTKNLPLSEEQADLAYIIYTSGSTGRPKGVQISHSNLCHYVQAMQQAIGLQTTDIYLHTASIAFSSSVRQLLLPLSQGATVAIATTEERADPLLLFAAIQDYGVTVIDLVPSYWRSCIQQLMGLSDTARQTLLDNVLRLILSASEPLGVEIPRQWRQDVKHRAQLINMFGQTETSGIVAVHPIPKTLTTGMTVVPLGRPIDSTQLYLLDACHQQVPLGVTGELYVGGKDVGVGYLNQPELTASCFIPNPFGEGRLYRTGDLARLRMDDTLEFVSRVDHQVKLRGFRIELGEVESVLMQHPLVQAAVVVLREEEPNQQYLVAYVVLCQETGEGTAQISTFVRTRLPDYMVPTLIVELEALPLTPNGKLDRTALPNPDLMQTGQQSATPRTPVETVLANLWGQLLHQGQVGIHDSFFDLGGHSLLATQVISQVRDAFQVELPLRALFETPTVAQLSARIETLMRSSSGCVTLPLQRCDRSGLLPLSFAQQRLWFLEQLEPGSVSYHLFRAVKLQGVLNLSALEQSLNEMMRRHESLRTCFQEVENQSLQIITEVQSFSIPVVDLRSICAAEQASEIQRRAQVEARQPFDLTQAPLLRATLLQFSATSQVLFLTLHHIIADGWSAGIFVRELATLYNAFCRDESASSARMALSDLPIQSADFALWQRQWLQAGLLESQLDYWQQQLAGDLTILNLPTDHPRPAVQSFRGKTHPWQLSAALTASLQRLSQQTGVTLFMTLLATFKVLLYRYTGQTDICVGSPIANRNRTEIEGLIGCFINTLVLRTDLSGNLSFQDLLYRVRETTLGAYTHQDFPFEKLIEILQPERNLSHSPLFQVLFGLQQDPLQDLTLNDLVVDVLEIERETARFDLTLSLLETEQGLRGTVEYNTDLFDTATIQRMLGHYETLLEQVVADASQPICEIAFLSVSEKQQLLETWNQTQNPWDAQARTLPQWIATQSAKTPTAIALTIGDAHLNYQALNHRANQLAHSLQARGVQPEVLVGICMERSWEMVVGLLAILKAGGAYLPLDASYPPERLAHIIETAQPQILLTQSACRHYLPTMAVPILCLEDHIQEISQQPETCPEVALSPEHLAYVLYTSGSTGQPKGVEISHRALSNFLQAMQIKPGITAQDSLLAVTTIAFDIAALELFLPLTVGARVVIASRETAMDGVQLLTLLQGAGITVMQGTPSTWQLLLNAGWQGNRRLKMLCGGEALSPQLAQALLQCGGSLWNLYGPTETTIWSLLSPIETAAIVTGTESVRIGWPIANTQVYVLDEQLQPLPIGIPGELYIGGDGVARGYRHRLDLTEERFLPNPFHPGKTLYKTGDRVRYCPDGSLEYLGRLDHQVKVRGFRVELGEVEVTLNQHPAVQGVIVLALEDRLVAYVVTTAAERLTGCDLQRWLQRKLPAYMVPSAVVLLSAFPLMPNGKVDRRALRQRQPVAEPTLDLALPTPTVEILTSLWCQVLGLTQIGLHDNFFALGGHSLLATQLISRIRTVFAIELPLQRLFETPTIVGLATALAVDNQDPDGAPPPLDKAQGHVLPLSFAQQRLWFLEQLEPNRAIYNIPAAVRLRGYLNISALEQSINALIERHEGLRTTFQVVEGQPQQVVQPARSLPLTIIDCSTLEGFEQSEQLLAIVQQPFDLAHGPLLRVAILRSRTADDDHGVLFVMHHIVTDGWSMGVLIREIAALYGAFTTGEPVMLPELPLQYADFSHWQHQWLQGSVLDRKLAYWKQQLAHLTPLQLPTDYPRSAVSKNSGATHTFRLSTHTSEALITFSHQENVTLFMTLLTAFQILLHRQTQQTDVVVGTDVANRTDVALEGLIGFFVNLLVLRTDFSGNPTVREVLHRVRTVALGAYAHQDVPFAKVVEALRPERQVNATPLFQILFVLQNAPMPPLELPGLTLEHLTMESGTARFDIALFITETEQGIQGIWRYNAQLFAADTIAQLSNQLETVLESFWTQPETHIHTLPIPSQPEPEKQPMQHPSVSRLPKFAQIQPQPIRLDAAQLIQTSFLQDNATFPLVIQPGVTDLDIADWAKAHRSALDHQLQHHGAVLFRGVGIESAIAFEHLAAAICPRLYGEYGDLPRQDVGGKIYGSTPYPADQAILFHSESSHLSSWPQKIWFCCLQPASAGGETLIVDCRQVLQRLKPALRDKFERLQLLYMRNYIDGLDVSWQEFFQTADRAVVEARCRQADIAYKWLPENGLRTQQIRSAITVHPQTGESIFFNQLQLHHPACLEPGVRAALSASFGTPDNFPRNVYYGDGSEIEDEAISEILEIYQTLQVSFPWQQGDVLMLDNMLMAHGRNPYRGPRQVVVAMGDMLRNPQNMHQPQEAVHVQ